MFLEARVLSTQPFDTDQREAKETNGKATVRYLYQSQYGCIEIFATDDRGPGGRMRDDQSLCQRKRISWRQGAGGAEDDKTWAIGTVCRHRNPTEQSVRRIVVCVVGDGPATCTLTDGECQ